MHLVNAVAGGIHELVAAVDVVKVGLIHCQLLRSHSMRILPWGDNLAVLLKHCISLVSRPSAAMQDKKFGISVASA